MSSYTLVTQRGTHAIANATAHLAILLSRAGLNLDPNKLSQRMYLVALNVTKDQFQVDVFTHVPYVCNLHHKYDCCIVCVCVCVHTNVHVHVHVCNIL